MVAGRGRLILASMSGVALVIGAAARLRTHRGWRQPDGPADVRFMRALHMALRRDMSRLRAAAGQPDKPASGRTAVLAGWDGFQAQLHNHHAAEDDDLWPVLRRELSDDADLTLVDAMVEEHRHLSPALTGVDQALRGGGDLAAPVEQLATVLMDHLAREEREVLPLIERHLTWAQWRAFLHKERNRRSPRQRAEFLAWILDSADDESAAAVLSEMPPMARFVHRRILKPCYERQRRWADLQQGE